MSAETIQIINLPSYPGCGHCAQYGMRGNSNQED